MTTKTQLLFILLIACPLLVFAQPNETTLDNDAVESPSTTIDSTADDDDEPNFRTGLIMDEVRYNSLPRQPQFKGTKFSELPLKVDLKKYAPYPGNQGEIESCVGWAVGYAALSIQRAIEFNVTDRQRITQNANSAMFIYNQIKVGDCNSGSRIEDAIHFVSLNGDCFAKDFDHNVQDCDAKPDPKLLEFAKKNAIGDYMTLFGADTDPKIKIFKMKQSLAQNKPVIIGMETTKGFHKLKKGSTYWWADKGNTTPAGGHAMAVIGYNEAKKAFELFNSWGRNWGNDGCIWVKYDELAKHVKYGYQLHLEKERGKPVELAGKFGFRYLVDYDKNDEPIFEFASPILNGDHYTLSRTDWEVGQNFQLLATNDIKDEYVYIFSIDPNNKPTLHWPRNGEYSSRFEGLHESAFIPMEGAEIVIPSRESALYLSEPGTDILCVLFSSEKIEGEDLRNIAKNIVQLDGDFMERLYNTLGDQLIPTSDIRYRFDNISFKAYSESGGTIVPLVLKVEAK